MRETEFRAARDNSTCAKAAPTPPKSPSPSRGTRWGGDLSDLGNYLDMIAKGDPVIVDASGFPSFSTARTPDSFSPAAPIDVRLRLRQSEVSGSLVMRFKLKRPKSMSISEVQRCLGDPNVEAN